MNSLEQAGWAQGEFWLAGRFTPMHVSGWVNGTLGLDKRVYWVVSHLATGFQIACIQAPERRALEIADEIARLGDWSFEGPDGWQNQFPDCAEQIARIRRRFPSEIVSGEPSPRLKRDGDEYEMAAIVRERQAAALRARSTMENSDKQEATE